MTSHIHLEPPNAWGLTSTSHDVVISYTDNFCSTLGPFTLIPTINWCYWSDGFLN
jgi:hypothetical protein